MKAILFPDPNEIRAIVLKYGFGPKPRQKKSFKFRTREYILEQQRECMRRKRAGLPPLKYSNRRRRGMPLNQSPIDPNDYTK